MAVVKIGVSSLEERVSVKEAFQILSEKQENFEVVIKSGDSEFNLVEKVERNFFDGVQVERKNLRLIPRD